MVRKKKRKYVSIKEKAEKLLKIVKLRELESGKKAKRIGRGIRGKDL